MNDKEDFSGLAFNAPFFDKRCEELGKVLRENPEFAGYRVIRQHWGNDWKLDPFFIQNEDEENLIFLEPEIVDTLSDSEFLSYIDVEIKHIESFEGTFWLLMAILVLTPVAIINSIMVLLTFANLEIIRAVSVTLALDLITLISAIAYYRKRNNTMSKKRHIDLVEARKNSAFLSGLRKLVLLPNLERGKDYRKRLKYIEDILGVDS
ncbi:MAG: hypothetical protein RTV72_06730 [Candidatus Thorarchaeota archaeon]